MTTGSESWLRAVQEGRLREVLAALPPWPNAESRPVLALLARLGEGPRIDVVAVRWSTPGPEVRHFPAVRTLRR